MSFSVEKKALYYRRAADATTLTRNGLGIIVAANALSGDRILPDNLRHRSVGSGVVVAAIGGLDKLDGYLAGKSEDYGLAITQKNSSFDSDMDKKNNKVFGYSFTARNIAEGIVTRSPRMLTHAAVTAGYSVWTNHRDERMAKSRAHAVEGADTSAITTNKWKTFLQNAGHSIEASPMGAIVPQVSEAVYLASCALGEIGLKKADEIHATIVERRVENV